jgi:hypothetical protein
MAVLTGFVSLAVDVGRVQVVKTELRQAADAAARAGAGAMEAGIPFGRSEAVKYAAKNNADGTPVVLNSTEDIQFGKWDSSTKTFEVLTGSALDKANACRVLARRTDARGNAVPLIFMKLLGRSSCDVNAESIAMLIPSINVNETVLATANPLLAGMPPGTVASNPNPHRNPDIAGDPTTSTPKASPKGVSGIPVNEGAHFTFDSIDGTARHDPNLPYFDPDGQMSDIGHNNPTTNHSNNYSSQFYNEHGIADMLAPINSLVGVFLSDEQPNLSSAPDNLKFNTETSRDFAELKPKLKQLFWIGDGKNSDGIQQNFIAPEGATRLMLATWDFYEWNNNAGYRIVKINRPQQVITVK